MGSLTAARHLGVVEHRNRPVLRSAVEAHPHENLTLRNGALVIREYSPVVSGVSCAKRYPTTQRPPQEPNWPPASPRVGSLPSHQWLSENHRRHIGHRPAPIYAMLGRIQGEAATLTIMPS